jgi:hypothetical protein
MVPMVLWALERTMAALEFKKRGQTWIIMRIKTSMVTMSARRPRSTEVAMALLIFMSTMRMPVPMKLLVLLTLKVSLRALVLLGSMILLVSLVLMKTPVLPVPMNLPASMILMVLMILPVLAEIMISMLFMIFWGTRSYPFPRPPWRWGSRSRRSGA